MEWQIKQLSHLMWLNEEQNVILLGKCGTGKTSLAVHLGETVIDNGHKYSIIKEVMPMLALVHVF